MLPIGPLGAGLGTDQGDLETALEKALPPGEKGSGQLAREPPLPPSSPCLLAASPCPNSRPSNGF